MAKEQIENLDSKVVEVEDNETGVAPSKGGRTFTLFALAFVVAVGLYFFLLSPEKEEVQEVSDEIVIEPEGKTPVVDELPVSQQEFPAPQAVEQTFESDFSLTEVPELPQLSDDVKKTIEKAEEEKRLEEERAKQQEEARLKAEEERKSLEEKINLLEERIAAQNEEYKAREEEEEEPIIIPTQSIGQPLPTVNGIAEIAKDEETTEMTIAQKRALEQRKSTSMLTKKGSGGPKSSFVDAGGIVLSNTNTVSSLQVVELDASAKRVKDLTTTILQGKLIYAVLETAINTDLKGTLRGIVNRDVYAEKGKNILISKGSRLIGTYESGIQRGQNRLMITWNRIIRTDGVEIAITSGVTDQFGRSGLQGTVDNKYVEVLGNALLTSWLSIASAAITQEVANTSGISNTTNDSGEIEVSSGNASDYAIIDATQSFMDTAKQFMEDNAATTTPTMRIPQGVKLIVFVNQDLSIPPLED